MYYITDLRPNVLNASVIDARGRQCYKIVTDQSQPHRTAYYDVHRRTVALVDWAGSMPAVEMPGLLPRQPIRTWLQTASDRAYVPTRLLPPVFFCLSKTRLAWALLCLIYIFHFV
jgi:hypothetical protein